ncbi:MAG: prenyltransferase/squalene oxidase repeat-containing protein [Planctomycetaceae bacterium]
MFRIVLTSLCSLPLTCVSLSDVTAQTSQPRRTSSPALVTPVTQSAIGRGLSFLAAQQHSDGSFGSGGTYQRNVAVTSLVAMAFLSGGHTPGRGLYGRHVQQAIDNVMQHVQPSGFIHSSDQANGHGPMYGHGFATLFLAEVHGMSRHKQLPQKLQRAVQLIIRTQNSEGGWRYFPVANDADVSVTVCQVMALRAARNAGIEVPKQTINRAVEYLRSCQNEDGGFRYQTRLKRTSRFPRSAAGIMGLMSAGIYQGAEINRGLDFLEKHRPSQSSHPQDHYYYGQYYATQALWHAGGKRADQWYAALRRDLLSRQLPSGAWTDAYICNEYGTAMACLILQVPNNYLPIFER